MRENMWQPPQDEQESVPTAESPELKAEEARLRKNLEELSKTSEEIGKVPEPRWIKVAKFLERGDRYPIIVGLSAFLGRATSTGNIEQSVAVGIAAGLMVKFLGLGGGKKEN